MTGEEILREMSELLSFHVRLGCSVHQAGYKNDYFRLFLNAYCNDYFDEFANPCLTGEGIRGALGTQWAREESPYNNKRLALLNAVLPMWDEWYFALKAAGLKVPDIEREPEAEHDSDSITVYGMDERARRIS